VITAIDTSVLLDVFTADPAFGRTSADMLRHCRAEGRLVACEVVWAEVAGIFPSSADALEALGVLEVEFAPVDADGALAAGAAWNAYRRRGGKRERVIADFLVGAHAVTGSDRLLTRDRGFYRSYFERLAVLDPSR
jgi:predicted nucleic acid-binding protein